MKDSPEEVDGQGNGKDEGEDVTDGLTDFYTEEAQQAGQNQNLRNEKDTIAGCGKNVGR